MVTNVDQIRAVLNERTNFLKDAYNVSSIGVFGSVARSQNTESSDIDLLVEFSKPISMFAFIELENVLSEALGKKVDLVTKRALKPIIKDDILKEVVYV